MATSEVWRVAVLAASRAAMAMTCWRMIMKL
jgi:hypothetical protein